MRVHFVTIVCNRVWRCGESFLTKCLKKMSMNCNRAIFHSQVTVFVLNKGMYIGNFPESVSEYRRR